MRSQAFALWLLCTACAHAQILQAPEPPAQIDLMTTSGAATVDAVWRYRDVELVRVAHRSADAAGQPAGAPVSTWDITPHAGGRDFDDSSWEVVPPEQLTRRRGAGRFSYAWYRLSLRLPPQVQSHDVRGMTVAFETSIDDYAEVWVDGELPRALAQSGGSVIKGWNATNRVILTRNAVPGQTISVAVFGINGPLSDPPANFIWMRLARLEFSAGDAHAADPIAVVPQEVNVAVRRLDPALDAIVPSNPKIFKLAEGFQFTEGPIWRRDRSVLLFSDPNANRIYQYDPLTAALTVFREHSGYAGADIAEYSQPGSNGMTLDREGRLTVNQHGNRRIIRMEADGRETVLADRYSGKRLNSPNDLVYRSDGSLYFTDPPFGLPGFFKDRRKELPFSGVFRAFHGKVALLTKELEGPNGIAFSPDEKYLYVDDWDPLRKVVLRFPVQPDGSLGRSGVFADMTTELAGDEALDGMKVDQRGNLYVTAPDGVRIYAPSGTHLGTITAPRTVHNLAWGGDEGRTLYLCAQDRLYRIELLIPGVRP